MIFFTEYCLVAVLIAAAYLFPRFPTGYIQRVERLLYRFAVRRSLVVLVVGILAVGVRLALLPNMPVPVPGIHDDFGYLLAADTFVHGRLANPTHPMWVHFETIYTNMKPVYMPMYYAGQGLLLALGEVIAHQPWAGVLLATAAMCAAICWMLQGWMPPGWALLGGLLAVMRLGTFTYWANSYCGGSLAAVGGALVLGALPRIKRRQRIRDALWMGLGLAFLANTRPYETLFFCVPVAVALFAWMFHKKGPPLPHSLRRVVLPISLVMVPTIAFMAYFFYRVTGSPFRVPYQVNLDTYLAVPYFPWQPLNLTHTYHHHVLEQFYLRGWQMVFYNVNRSRPYDILVWKLRDIYRFFVGPALALPIVLLFITDSKQFFRDALKGRTGFLVAVCFATFVGLALPIYFVPHYASPMTAAIYALVLQGMRQLRLWRWRDKAAGLGMVRAIPTICVLLFLVRAAAPQLHIPTPVEWRHTWDSEHFQNLDRAKAREQLEQLPGYHLVLVRYNDTHDIDSDNNEWVFNEADIDKAKVVWARDMGDADNTELISYFRNRDVWLAEPDLAPPRLSRYPVSASR